MGETEEFAEALLDQISVEINEEKEISKLSSKINDDSDIPNNFPWWEVSISQRFMNRERWKGRSIMNSAAHR